MSERIKILTVGAATQDVFLTGEALTAKRDVRSHDYVAQFPLGAKIELDKVFFDTGGGGTNAAVTFARQGLEAGFVGKIGKDPAGLEILRVLKQEGVNHNQVAYDAKLATGYSAILLAPSGERTPLTYRGASHDLEAGDFNFTKLSADWFYITSLAGNLDFLKKLLGHAKLKNIQVAFNPGGDELEQPKKLLKLLSAVTVLLGNKEELGRLSGREHPREIIERAVKLCPVVALTDGAQGSASSDGRQIYYTGQYKKVKVVDRTGAGDAFGSGFVAALARGWSIPEALTLGSANATAVVQQIGAKPGILRTSRVKRMKVKVIDL